jgi:hypothetical protein
VEVLRVEVEGEAPVGGVAEDGGGRVQHAPQREDGGGGALALGAHLADLVEDGAGQGLLGDLEGDIVPGRRGGAEGADDVGADGVEVTGPGGDEQVVAEDAERELGAPRGPSRVTCVAGSTVALKRAASPRVSWSRSRSPALTWTPITSWRLPCPGRAAAPTSGTVSSISAPNVMGMPISVVTRPPKPCGKKSAVPPMAARAFAHVAPGAGMKRSPR